MLLNANKGMKWILTGGILLILSYQDLKTKSISVGWIILLYVLCSIDFVLQKNVDVFYLWSIVPGIILLILGIFTHNQIGIGDGLVLIGVGLVCGLQNVISIFLISSISVGIVATLLLIGKRGTKDTSLPFLPFVCGSYFLLLLMKLLNNLL